MGKYENENWVKNGEGWVNIRMEIKLNFGFFDGKKKWRNIRIFQVKIFGADLCLSQTYPLYTTTGHEIYMRHIPLNVNSVYRLNIKYIAKNIKYLVRGKRKKN